MKRIIKSVMTYDKPTPLRSCDAGGEYTGELGGTMPTRADGAARAVLASWTQNWDTEIVEENGVKHLIAWVPLQGGEGGPASMFNVEPITRFATTVAVGDKVQRKPQVSRSSVPNIKATRAASTALKTIARSTGMLAAINAANAKFYGADR